MAGTGTRHRRRRGALLRPAAPGCAGGNGLMRGAWRVVLAGCLAELATVVVIVLTITVHQRLTGAGPAENEAFARSVGARLGPVCGTLFVFFFAFWAAS